MVLEWCLKKGFDARLEWLIEDLMVLKEELTLSRTLDARAGMRVRGKAEAW
jgi:hypothetical protein